MYGDNFSSETRTRTARKILITSVQSRPLVSDGSLIPRLFSCQACSYICCLAFSAFGCLCLELLLTQGEGVEFLWEIFKSVSYRRNGDK